MCASHCQCGESHCPQSVPMCGHKLLGRYKARPGHRARKRTEPHRIASTPVPEATTYPMARHSRLSAASGGCREWGKNKLTKHFPPSLKRKYYIFYFEKKVLSDVKGKKKKTKWEIRDSFNHSLKKRHQELPNSLGWGGFIGPVF